METTNRIADAEFHAVDFMRKVRRELSEKYLQNNEQYIKDLKKALDDFKCRQEKAYGQSLDL